MYDFGEIDRHVLNKENVMRLVPEDRLWRHYLGFDFEVGKTYKSPLRTDPTPSFSIFRARRLGDKIMARDHGGQFAGDIIDYICFTERVDFYTALIKINEDFGLGLRYTKVSREGVPRFREHKVNPSEVPRIEAAKKISGVIYEIVERPYLASDIGYWISYGITRHTLNQYGVRCVGVLYCNGMCCYTYQYDNPCYEYPFPSGNRKYYWPFAQEKSKKFRGNIDNEKDMQGYYQTRMSKHEESNLLVITKSMKDVMLLHQYGVDAIAIHGENHRFNNDFIRHMKKYNKRVISLYDNDETGKRGAEYLCVNHQIEPYFITEESAKDITDLYKKDKKKADEFVMRLINTTTNTCVL